MPSSHIPYNQSAQEKSLHVLTNVREEVVQSSAENIYVYDQVQTALSWAELCFRGVLFGGWVWVLFCLHFRVVRMPEYEDICRF